MRKWPEPTLPTLGAAVIVPSAHQQAVHLGRAPTIQACLATNSDGPVAHLGQADARVPSPGRKASAVETWMRTKHMCDKNDPEAAMEQSNPRGERQALIQRRTESCRQHSQPATLGRQNQRPTRVVFGGQPRPLREPQGVQASGSRAPLTTGERRPREQVRSDAVAPTLRARPMRGDNWTPSQDWGLFMGRQHSRPVASCPSSEPGCGDWKGHGCMCHHVRHRAC